MAADGVRVFPAVELKVGPEAADGERVSPAADLKVDPETEYMVTDGDRVSPAADLKAVPEMGDMATDGKRVTPTADPKALVVPSTKMSAETQESIRLGLASSLAGEALDYFLGEGVFFRDDPSFSNSLPGDDMERIELVHEALLAIQANRHKDAIACINHVAMLGRRLSCSERALFAVSTVRATLDAKKSVDLLMSRGSSINTTTELEAGMLAEYSSRVRLEFQNTCLSQIGVIEKLLLPTSTGESLVSYLRIKGLVLEVLARADSTSLNRYWALSSYMAAFEKAEQQLCPSNMERLYAALDLTLFLEGAMNDLESAYVISRKALHEANSELQLRGPRDPDISESVRLFKQLGSRVTELSILVTGYQDLVPDKDYWKVRSKTSSPEYRNCKSDNEGKWMVKLPQNLLCPEVEPYELERYEDEEDYLHSRLVGGFSGGV